jgi:pantothenate kinase type III
MKASALDMTNRRKVPAISVYLLIENKKLEEYLSYMFKDISARLLRLHRNNFFPEDVLNGLSKAPFMSVDRLACLYAAKSDYSACPLLLINCGNSISYTGLDKDGKIVGGGACAGLNMRFRALYDFDDQEDVPSIGLDEYKKMFDDAAKEGKPLPLFSEDVEISIMANVTSEVTGHLRNLVRQFLSVAKKENVGPAVPNIPAHIVFYGPDGDFLCKFLLKDCPVGVNFEPGTLIPSEKDISIHSRTNLVTYGIQHLLENEEKKTSPPNPDEVLRERVLGLRGAMATTLTVNGISKPDTYRGTFVNVIPMKTFEEDMFEIVFDNDGEREILDLKGLYGR